ncbi:MAG: radical SAM protein [Candidatus Saganbacteria bacterium]|uniref:Radical SAM protein n=1 Tax=Candidatus Saganbacteria bacterium TaxID=2575572 RepID=A0A833L1K8_UNCSA|nr:MAG: radical SAM protein [Candidatus Saganbacteria bacterium]
MKANPKILYLRSAWQALYPVGVIQLIDYLHKKYPFCQQKLLDLTLFPKKERWQQIFNEIKAFQPDFICYSWRDIQIFLPSTDDKKTLELTFKALNPRNITDLVFVIRQYFSNYLAFNGLIYENLYYIKKIRQCFPSISFILGGTAFSLFGEALLKKCPNGTIGVVGEGEPALDNIIFKGDIDINNVLVKKNGKIARGQKPASCLNLGQQTKGIDFEYIFNEVFPQLGYYFQNPNSYIGVQTKRGCLQKCIFCNSKTLEGATLRFRPIQAVIEDITCLNKNYGVKNIWFTDSQFISSDACLVNNARLLEEIIIRQLDIKWSSYIRLERIDKKFAELLVKSGLDVFELSLTSGSQRMVDFLKLGFSLKDVYQKATLLKEAGFQNRVIINYSLNAPGETKASLMESVVSYQKLVEIFGWENVWPEIFFLGVTKGSELEEYLIRNKKIPRDGVEPLKLNLKSAKYSVYNPLPFNKVFARLFFESLKEKKLSPGKYIMENLEKAFERMRKDHA